MPEVVASKKAPAAKLVDGDVQGGGHSPRRRKHDRLTREPRPRSPATHHAGRALLLRRRRALQHLPRAASPPALHGCKHLSRVLPGTSPAPLSSAAGEPPRRPPRPRLPRLRPRHPRPGRAASPRPLAQAAPRAALARHGRAPRRPPEPFPALPATRGLTSRAVLACGVPRGEPSRGLAAHHGRARMIAPTMAARGLAGLATPAMAVQRARGSSPSSSLLAPPASSSAEARSVSARCGHLASLVEVALLAGHRERRLQLRAVLLPGLGLVRGLGLADVEAAVAAASPPCGVRGCARGHAVPEVKHV
nr:uncharacterized protein LOC127339335 [Lolium perenne]